MKAVLLFLISSCFRKSGQVSFFFGRRMGWSVLMISELESFTRFGKITSLSTIAITAYFGYTLYICIWLPKFHTSLSWAYSFVYLCNILCFRHFYYWATEFRDWADPLNEVQWTRKVSANFWPEIIEQYLVHLFNFSHYSKSLFL